MSRNKPEAGETYRLTSGIGGFGPAALYPGQVVTVREVVEADVAGAHNDAEDAVVIELGEDGPVMGDDGQVTRGTVTRATSVSLATFGDFFVREA